MKNNKAIQSVFRGLADPTRRQILMLLVKQEMTIGEVCAFFPITRAAVKKHLTVLEEGGLVSVHKHGREQINRFEPLAMKIASAWLAELDQFWDARLADLKHSIESRQDNEHS